MNTTTYTVEQIKNGFVKWYKVLEMADNTSEWFDNTPEEEAEYLVSLMNEDIQ